MADAYRWIAYYRDGDTLEERDGVGFGHIDQSRLVALQLVPLRSALPTPHVAISEGMRPILFRRRSIHVNVETGQQEQGATITVIGWQRTVNGANVKALLACFEDGSVMLTDDSEAF